MQKKTQTKNDSRFSLAVITALALVLALALTACSGSSNTGETGSAGSNNSGASDEVDTGVQEIKSDESLIISVSEISETPSYYTFEIDGVTMEVVALKASDGTIRTAYNTCQVCNGSPKAYFVQSGDTLQCQNCGNKFPLDKVGVEKGGCNPAPIIDEDKTVTDESVTISYDVLNTEKSNFTNWKKGL